MIESGYAKATYVKREKYLEGLLEERQPEVDII
jgi:hypothetical protein